jgi:predicted Zn-dependent protease
VHRAQRAFRFLFSVPTRSEHFQALVDRDPSNELFRFSLAQALVTEGREPEARPHFEYCVAKKADWMMPRILLGKNLLQAGLKDKARPLLQSALQLAIEQNHETPEAELRSLLASFE